MRQIRAMFGALLLLSGSLMAQAIVRITPETIDAGRIQEGQSIDGAIRFMNNGPGPVTVQRVQASCGCTTTRIEKLVLAKGETANVAYSIRTRGFRGMVRKSITVFFADPNLQPLSVTVQATVFSDIEVEPSFVDFQSIRVNPDTVLVETVTVRNQSAKAFHIKSVRATHEMLTVSPASLSLEPNLAGTIRISLRPSRAVTAEPDVWLETDSPTRPKISIPVLIYIQDKK